MRKEPIISIEKSEKFGYEVFETQSGVWKLFRSSKANYNFNKLTGYMESWGKTEEEDPEEFPAPNILDLEVTTSCKGGCKFCFPKGTKVMMSDGTEKDISDIVIGDKVLSYDTSSLEKKENVVEEVYDRNYKGIMITFELENGIKITATENHPFYVLGKGWVEAKNIKEGDVFLVTE